MSLWKYLVHVQIIQKRLVHLMNLCYGVFCKFWVIFRYVLEEIGFLEGFVKFRKVRNIEDNLMKF